MDYNSFREFADSWGLLYLVIIFLSVIVMVFLPGAKDKADNAAGIPFRNDKLPDEGPEQ